MNVNNGQFGGTIVNNGQFGGTIVNNGQFCQTTVPTGTAGIRTAANLLRRLGYRVSVSSLGNQITQYGRIKTSLIDVRPGDNADTFGASAVIRTHVAYNRD